MIRYVYISSLVLLLSLLPWVLTAQQKVSFDFYGDTIEFEAAGVSSVPFNDGLSGESINLFYQRISATEYKPVIDALLAYKQRHAPDDWVYYQLVRRTAQAMSPKADNYYRYTLYKWFLLSKSGYSATLNIVNDKLLFYVQCNEEIFDLPFFNRDGKQFICLNYHDYGFNIDFKHDRPDNVAISVPGADQSFSYRLTRLPEFREDSYHEKELVFNYQDVNYRFMVKMNDEVKKIFTNYPVVDYQLYFNAPLSKATYNSLIPQLKEQVNGMSVKHGVDYLMRFTRYSFMYQPDAENFGREKHLSPEQTLLYDRSDCEDRAALFYCLVKEIYNLPMIVLAFPQHLTIAVKFDKPVGQPILYNGNTYSICEPTPNGEDLPIGKLSKDLKTTAYEVAYVYDPAHH